MEMNIQWRISQMLHKKMSMVPRMHSGKIERGIGNSTVTPQTVCGIGY